MADIGMKNVWNQISLDGYTNETLKKMVGVENYNQRAFSSIENLLSENLKVRVNIVLTPINYLESTALVKKLYKMRVKRIGFAGYGRSHYRHSDDLFLTDPHIEFINNEVDKLKKELKGIELTSSVGKRSFLTQSKEKRA